jgi:hypothetical protein
MTIFVPRRGIHRKRVTAVADRMGLTLSADYTGPNGTGNWFIPVGLAARSGFPATDTPSNGVLNLAAGTYKASTRMPRNSDYQQLGVRLKDAGGNVLATIYDQYFNTHEFINTSFTHPGGLLTFEAASESTFSGANVIKAGAFLEVMPSTWATLQGLLFNGTQSVPANAYTLLTGWVVDPEHPGSSVTTNGITIVGDGPVTVKCYARMIDANTSGNKFQMYKNGSPISGTEFIANPAALTTQWGGTFTHTFANGDLLQMYGYSTGTVSNRRQFTGDSTKSNTYFELMPA